MAFPLDLASFRARFPEFTPVDDALVEAKLADAADEIDERVWGGLAEKGHGWLAAHLLTSSSYGRETSKESTTTYGTHYEDLRRRVGTAYRVILD